MANPGMTKRQRREFMKTQPNPRQPASELEQRVPVKVSEPEPKKTAKKKTKKKATKKKKKV